jgi:long-chain acyl-CoA synthetase
MDISHTLQELRSEIAARGELAAIIASAGGEEETWSFSELADVSARVANGLVQRGIGRGSSVAIIAPNSPRWIGAFWAIIAAGATAVPLDLQANDAELARMLEIADCRWAFTVSAAVQRLTTLAPSCRPIILDADSNKSATKTWADLRAAPNVEFPAVTAADEAVIVFTSGTTGTPKAVPLTHANLLANINALATTGLVGRGDRALLPLPLYHAYPLTIGMLTPLAVGCGIVLPAGISGPELVGAMRQGQVTALVGVPRLYTALLDNVRRGIAAQPRPMIALTSALLAVAGRVKQRGVDWPGRILLRPVRRKLAPDLRLLVSGGAPISAEVEEALGAMGWEMLTGYGLVETSAMLTFNLPGAALPGSVGRPVPGTEVRIASPDEHGIGEIETRGPSLFSGYRGDPTKTREAFTEDGWFRTADLGWIDGHAYLHIAARKGETIVLADGKKLFPEEFEGVYATAPLVREIALLGHNGALVGLVVPDLTAAREFGTFRLVDAIREGLATKARSLPSYARLSGFAIARAALPRTQLGKIRRHLLPPLYSAAERHEAPPAAPVLSAEDRAFLDRPEVAIMWRWLQQRFPDRNLQLESVPQIDLGIDSLDWVELTLALERDLGIVLRESEIAQIVTLRDLLRKAAAAPKTETGAALRSAEAPWLAPLGPALTLLRSVGELLLRLVMRGVFDLQVEGLEFLPMKGPMLLCPNHVSYLDPFALGAALPKEFVSHTCWGGWTGVAFTTRFRRLFSRAARIMPIDPDRAAASGLAMGRLTLERGWNLVWFPEGGRSADGTLQRFLPRVGVLVEKHPVPIVPVYIEGSFSAWPVARRLPRPRRITVRFGPSIAVSAGRIRDQEIVAAIRASVAALAKLTERPASRTLPG